MSNFFPIIFSLSFFFPGILEAYAAFKVFPFMRYRGGLALFSFLALSAQFDLLFSGLMIIVIIFGANFVVDLPWDNSIVLGLVIYLVTSLFLWRFASGMISLWFAGKITEEPIRKLLGIKEKE